MTEYIFPKKIIYTKEEKPNLLVKQPLQIGLAETKFTRFNNGEYVILDFGKEMCGGIKILTASANDTPVRIRFGESVSECCTDVGGPTNATNDHSNRDFKTNLQTLSGMTYGQTGFRFVRIDFYGFALIKSIVAENNILKKTAIYRYKGNDPVINDIYNVAKRTVDLCASSGYIWDGIKRDRLIWIGDMLPEVIALTTLYGRLKCIERSLDFVKEQTTLPKWMNNMPTYSMWWIIILAEYYKRVGAKDFIEKQMSYLKSLIGQMESCVKENGELDYPSYFVDWPTHEKPDKIHGVRAINIIAVKSAIYLLKEFGTDSANAEKLLERLLKIDITVEKSKQVLGLKYFAVGLDTADKNKLIDSGAKGMSTFMSYFILKAVASFDKERAVDMMKEYYGTMLNKGATTFWEDFDIDWAKNSSRIDQLPIKNEKDIHGDFGAYCYKGHRHSLCHGWSAGVIAFMKEENL